MTPTTGNWFRVTSGPHHGKAGVCDLVKSEGAGIRYRLTNRTEIVGRFAAEQLEPCANPQSAYVSQVPAEVTQRAMDMLTGRRSLDEGREGDDWFEPEYESEPLPASTFYDLDLATQDRLTSRQQTGMAGRHVTD